MRFIVKLTGKYCLFGLDDQLSKVPDDVDVIIQSQHWKLWQNTELVGFRMEIFPDILLFLTSERYLNNYPIEMRLYDYIHSENPQIYRLPKMWVPPQMYTRRDHGDVLKYL